MLCENWATLWEALADAQPDHAAVVLGDRRIRWRTLDERAACLAAAFTDLGVGRETKVAQLLFNCPEYLETVYAAFKCRALPVNVNYRYLPDEIVHVLANSDAEVLVYQGSLAERVAAARARLPKLKALVQVDDGSPHLDGALRFEELVAGSRPMARRARSGDDLLILYTGGTTGLPKGVVWRHFDLFQSLSWPGYIAMGMPVPTTPAELGRIAAELNAAGRSPINLCAPPFMHGASLFLAMSTFVLGGTVVILGGRSYDADELLSLVERERVTQLSIVGDAFAKPIVAALERAERQGRSYDLSSLKRITSTGATFSAESKRAIGARQPVTIIDMIGASEGGPYAVMLTPAGADPGDTAVFKATDRTVLFDPDTGERLQPGAGRIGVLAITGVMPLAYYGDPVKSAATFREIDGVRYSMPGDYASVTTDGTVYLLGRGAVCINTGGEKVYSEEVEVAAGAHPGVADCNAVGVPDDRFGEIVVLVVARTPGAVVTEEQVIGHVKGRLASYKAPRRVVFVDAVKRSPAGKADYRWAKAVAIAGGASNGSTGETDLTSPVMDTGCGSS